jgi:iron complex transport system substrate-binding protein
MNAEIEAAATDVIDCALAIHKKLGPGLFGTVYEVILAHKLKARGYSVQRQVAVPMSSKSFVSMRDFEPISS